MDFDAPRHVGSARCQTTMLTHGISATKFWLSRYRPSNFRKKKRRVRRHVGHVVCMPRVKLRGFMSRQPGNCFRNPVMSMPVRESRTPLFAPHRVKDSSRAAASGSVNRFEPRWRLIHVTKLSYRTPPEQNLMSRRRV